MAVDRFGTKFDRLYVAVVTPMKENDDVDEPALRKLLQYFMQPKFREGGGAIIINPEAGELFALRRQEKTRNVKLALEEHSGKVPLGIWGLPFFILSPNPVGPVFLSRSFSPSAATTFISSSRCR